MGFFLKAYFLASLFLSIGAFLGSLPTADHPNTVLGQPHPGSWKKLFVSLMLLTNNCFMLCLHKQNSFSNMFSLLKAPRMLFEPCCGVGLRTHICSNVCGYKHPLGETGVS